VNEEKQASGRTAILRSEWTKIKITCWWWSQPLPRGGGAVELRGDTTVGPRPKA